MTTPVEGTTETVVPPLLRGAAQEDPTIQGDEVGFVFDEIPQLERYRLVRMLGSGGMGQVWLAEDPVLSREVAIKLVVQHGRERAERLAREARSLARLSHPHVVSVFDVGTIGTPARSVFIVMELVRGPTLSQWLEPHRTAEEIVGVFVQAAAGLAAAHGAGLVHRDFKPANVFVGDDGRVRVGDFGLARPGGPSVVGPLSSIDDASDEHDLTATGMVLGTPMYMAPEQHRGPDLDASSDQYAFCVALYEALSGRRAFVFGKPSELLAQKMARKLVPPLPGRAIPKRLLDVVLRGLNADPTERWRTMDDLVAALRRRPAPVRTLVTAGVLSAGIVGAAALVMRDDVAACPEIARLDEAWSPGTRRAVTDAIAKAASPEVSMWAVGQIDARVGELRTAWEGDCTTQTGCVHDATTEIVTTIAALATDERAARGATTTVAELAAPSECDASETSTDPRLVAVRDAEAAAIAKWRANLHEEALAALADVRADAVALGELGARRTIAIDHRMGAMWEELGDKAKARESFERAYWHATELDASELAARAAVRLGVLEAELGDRDAAERWLRYTETTRVRGALSRCVAIEVGGLRGGLLALLGRFDESLPALRDVVVDCDVEACATSCLAADASYAEILLFRGEVTQGLARRREIMKRTLDLYPDDGPMVAWQRLPLAYALIRAELFDEAAAEVDLALATLTVAFGDRHPTLGTAYMYRATARSKQGRHAEAVADARLAVEFSAKAPDASGTMARLNTLGNVLGDAGDHAGAIEVYGRALAGGIVSGMHAGTMLSRGYTRMEFGDLEGAIADARAARAWMLENDPGDVGQLALTWGNEATAWQIRGDCDEARRVMDAGLAWARATGKEDPVRNLGEVDVELRAACAEMAHAAATAEAAAASAKVGAAEDAAAPRVVAPPR